MSRLLTLLVSLSPFLLSAATPEAQLRSALEARTGTVTLPAGTIEISRSLLLFLFTKDTVGFSKA